MSARKRPPALVRKIVTAGMGHVPLAPVTLALTRMKEVVVRGGDAQEMRASAYMDADLGLLVLVSRDLARGPGAPLVLHISVSHKTRYPTWDELAAVKKAFADHMTMAIYLPPPAEHVNAHPNCFHMWEAVHPVANGERW